MLLKGTMNKIRDILNEIKWQRKYDIIQVKIWYVHRGAPKNIKIISGTEIKSIKKTFLEIDDDTMIPHHRIMKIMYKDIVLFDRKTNK